MKNILFALIILGSACSINSSKTHEIDVDMLGIKVSISLPAEFDTSFTFIHKVAYQDGQQYKYIVCKKELADPKIDWFDSPPDTLYQMTLIHGHPNWREMSSLDELKSNVGLVFDFKRAIFGELEVIDQGVKRINGTKILYYLIKMGTQQNPEIASELNLCFKSNDVLVTLSFFCSHQKCTGFAENMKRYMNTLRIDDKS